jgi:hypothetical protein
MITLLLALASTLSLNAQFLEVTNAGPGSFSPEELIEDICLGDGIQVTSITYEGVPTAIGSFSNGEDFVGLEQGFLMTTGVASSNITGFGAEMESFMNASVNNPSTAYSSLIPTIANDDDIEDVAMFTIDFIPTGDTVMFRYVFASDEYPTFVCSSFNDVFGFFLEGQDTESGQDIIKNLATIPGTNLPVSINSVNSGQQGGYIGSNPIYCSEELNGSLDYASFFNVTNSANQPVYNGYTDVFVAKSAVVPCQPYRMTLIIADVGDALWDSGIFFEAQSFCSFNDGEIRSQNIVVTEDCAPEDLTLDLSLFPEEEYPLSYSISGNATAGEDFTDLELEGQIQDPAEDWTLATGIINDDIEESTDTLEVTITGSSCRQRTYRILIVDPIKIEGPDQAACAGEPVTLVATTNPLLLADYEFTWSDGQTGPEITVNPANTTVYTLTYENENGSCTADYTVNVSTTETFITATINEGESYDFGGNTYTAAGYYENLFTNAEGCDSLVKLDLQLITQPSTLTDSIVVGQLVERCIDTEVLQQVASFENVCPGMGLDLSLDAATACVTYFGQSPGLTEACIVACSDNGTCDTTYLLISVFDNLLDAVDDYDTTAYNEATTIDVLANDWIESTVLTDQYIVSEPEYGSLVLNADGSLSYAPSLTTCLQEDQFQYAICNDTGCDTATVFLFLDDTEGACDLVWPGDVNNDGIVNQMDHWAIGLAYGKNGPVRPNVSFQWVGQPAIDWNTTTTFAYEFNDKYADCNGNGSITPDDVWLINYHFGKTHQLSPPSQDFPELDRAHSLTALSQNGGLHTLALSMGSEEQPIKNTFGLSVELAFDPEKVANLVFDASSSALGEALSPLVKVDYEQGWAIISLVRTDQAGQHLSGTIGQLTLECPTGDCGTVTANNWMSTRTDANITKLSGTDTWNTGLTNTSSVDQTQVQLFPNPVRDQLIVLTEREAAAQLYNTAGQLQWQGQLRAGQNELAVGQYGAGLYILQLEMDGQILYRKVMINP